MQKTAYEMRISDWSSDVCSSDLLPPDRQQQARHDVQRRGLEIGDGRTLGIPDAGEQIAVGRLPMARREIGAQHIAGLKGPVKTHASMDGAVIVDHASRAELPRRPLRTLVTHTLPAAPPDQPHHLVPPARTSP